MGGHGFRRGGLGGGGGGEQSGVGYVAARWDGVVQGGSK